MITYRPYRTGDEAQIVQLYNSVFPRPQSMDHWNWAYKKNPVGRMDIILAYEGENLISHSAGIPLVLNHEGRAVQASRIQNVLVQEGFRGRGVFTETLVKLTERLNQTDVDFVLTFPNENSLPGFKKTGLYTHLFDISQFHLDSLIEPSKTSDELSFEVTDTQKFTSGDVECLEQYLKPFPIHTVRSHQYLEWRYSAASGNRYGLMRVFRRGKQCGGVVFKIFAAERSIDLLEFFLPNDEESIHSTLAALLKEHREQRLSAFNLWSMEYYPIHPFLMCLGFTKTERVTHVVYRCFSARCSTQAGSVPAYYLSMGDSDVF